MYVAACLVHLLALIWLTPHTERPSHNRHPASPPPSVPHYRPPTGDEHPPERAVFSDAGAAAAAGRRRAHPQPLQRPHPLQPARLRRLRQHERWRGSAHPLPGPRTGRARHPRPGTIETDFAGGLVRDNPHINAHLAAHTALGRVGLPDDIGTMAAALLSEEAGWMTAQRVEASGGCLYKPG